MMTCKNCGYPHLNESMSHCTRCITSNKYYTGINNSEYIEVDLRYLNSCQVGISEWVISDIYGNSHTIDRYLLRDLEKAKYEGKTRGKFYKSQLYQQPNRSYPLSIPECSLKQENKLNKKLLLI